MSSHLLRASSARPASPVCTVTDVSVGTAWTRTPAIRGILKVQRRASNASKSPSASAKRVEFDEEPMIRCYNPSESIYGDCEPEEPPQPQRPRIARKATGRTPDWITALAAKENAAKGAQTVKTQVGAAADNTVGQPKQPTADKPVTVPVQKTAGPPMIVSREIDGCMTVQLGSKLIVPVAALKDHLDLATLTTIELPASLVRRHTIAPRKVQTVIATDSRPNLGLGPAPCVPAHRHPPSYSLGPRHGPIQSEPMRRSVSEERAEEELALTKIVKSAIFLRHHLEGPVSDRVKLAIADLDIDTQAPEVLKALGEAVQDELDHFEKSLSSGDQRVMDHVTFLSDLHSYILDKC